MTTTHLQTAPTVQQPEKDEQAGITAAAAEVVDTLGSFLTATAKAGRHVMNLHDSLWEMHKQLEQLNNMIHYGPTMSDAIKPLEELEARRPQLLSNIQAEKQQFMWAVQELVDVTLKTV